MKKRARPIPTRSPDIILSVADGSLDSRDMLLRLNIKLLRNTSTNPSEDDLTAGQIRAESDENGTRITLIPNRERDQNFDIATLCLEAVALTLQDERWPTPIYAETTVGRDVIGQSGIFESAGFVEDTETPGDVSRDQPEQAQDNSD